MTKAANMTFTQTAAREWAARKVIRIEAAARAEGATEARFVEAAHNADHCATDDTTAAEWVDLFAASIF